MPTEANQIISPKVTKIVNRCKGHKLVFASVRDTVLFSFHEINIYILHGLYYYYMVFVVLSQNRFSANSANGLKRFVIKIH